MTLHRVCGCHLRLVGRELIRHATNGYRLHKKNANAVKMIANIASRRVSLIPQQFCRIIRK